ncbi:hypothetical protein ACG2F4_03790 [Halalkalibaculum sp. DA3122]|uniref:hypothetical protein n=1 Tax=Halalkalibaculum sp. DA3122 TaxID=3373607 RepID=UPI0037549C83
MKTTPYFTRSLFTLLFSFALLITACDNPASSDGDSDHDDHSEPYGLELIMNGETVIEYFNGQVTGDLHINEGEETALITVEFLNEEGEHIHDDDLDEEYSLGWNIENENILAIEQHDEDGRWSFHMHGKSAGASKVQFQLLHGDHADFETPAVTQDEAIEIHVDAVNQNE